jgi:ABC-type Fe3+ transport system substrate-binding protein
MGHNLKRWIGVFLLIITAGGAGFYLLQQPRHDPSPTNKGEPKRSKNLSKPNELRETNPLYAKAKAEGTVSIWTDDPTDVLWIGPAFAASYPGIKVEYRAPPNTVDRVLADYRAGRNDADLVWTSERLARRLKDADLLANPEWTSFGVSPENIGVHGTMAITSSWMFAVAYRTDLVDQRDVPQRWEQLIGRAYNGRMVATREWFTNMVAGIGAAQSELTWLEYAKRFCEKTNTSWTSSQRQLEQILSSGQRQYAVATRYSLATRWKKKGIPIDFVIPKPVVITQFGSVVMRDAPHPSGALLLAAWLASTEGKSSREKATFDVDLRSSSEHPLALLVRSSGHVIDDSDALMEARSRLVPKANDVVANCIPER